MTDQDSQRADDGVKPVMIGRSLTEGSISQTLYFMSVPMAAGLLATMSFNIVDTFFVAGLGQSALAALSFTFPVVMLAISLSIGLGAGASSVVAIAAGKGDEQAVKELTTDSMTLTVLLAVAFSVLGYFTIDPFFRAIGATDDVLLLVRDYMVPWYISAVFLMAPMVGMSSIRALGNTKMQGKLMLLMALANFILDPILIYGWWIFPRLEIEGASIASLIVRVVSFIVTIYFMHWRMKLFVNPFHFNRALSSWRKLLHVGGPAMATNMIIPLSGSVVVALVASHGCVAIAGFGIATRVEAMSLILFYALSAVIGPFCGQNLGAKKYSRLFNAQKISANFCIIAGLTVSVLLALAGKDIAALFSDEIGVIEATYWYLLIVPVSYCAYGIVMVVNASFNGLRRPLPGVVISSARVIVILIPLAWIGNAVWGLVGIFVAISLSNFIVGFIAYIWVSSTISRLRGLNDEPLQKNYVNSTD